MQPDQVQIAKDLIKIRGWRWLPPIRVINSSRHAYYLGSEIADNAIHGSLPDLNDDATAGVLLGLLGPKLHHLDEIIMFKPSVWHIRIRRFDELFTGSLGEAAASALIRLDKEIE